MCSIYTAKNSRLLSSFLLRLPFSHPYHCVQVVKMLMKVYLVNIWGFNRLRYFSKCTLIVIKSITKISYITSYVFLRTGATVKFINSKICVAIYNSLSHIVLIPISFFKFTSLQYTEKPGNVYHYIEHF